MEIYLDNSATTRCFDEVIDVMTKVYKEDYGNPSSLHFKGVEAEKYVKDAKDIIARNLKVNQKEVFFTSGGTESDNTALIGAALANQRSGRHLITTSIEHPAILQTMKRLEEMDFEVTYLPVDEYGIVRPEDVKSALRKDTILVSVMHTNNEVGALQPIAEIGNLIKEFNPSILFHVDAVQGYGKFRILPKKMNIDLMSVSGHKIHGPKGIGFLYKNEKAKMWPYILGGGQQAGVRSGTENVPGIAGIGKAIELVYENLETDTERLYRMREQFVKSILEIEDVHVNGRGGKETAPHIISVSVKGVRAEVLLHALEDKGIYVSAGSACASNKPAVSATLTAMKLPREYLDATIRFSMSVMTKEEDMETAAKAMKELIPNLRKYTRH